MRNWGQGYVTDIEYLDEFYSQQSPQNMALVSTLNGFEPPDLSGTFAYCELGCGKGLTSLILAAANPNAEFHAVDFNPAHIAHAQARARAAQLDNITFHERGFDDLNGPDAPELPMFDVVTMHGVWSWVSEGLQNAILEFLKRRVKTGGLVYVSYNAMPQWAMSAPLQRILKELAGLLPGGSDMAASNAFAMLEHLTTLNIIPAAFHEGVKQLTRGVAPDALAAYLAHEFLNEHWKPAYHADVARAFGSAKLTFAGSMDFLRNLSNTYLNESQQAALANIPAPDLRETLADFASGNWVRLDVFVRGARRIPDSRQDALLRAVRLALVGLAPDFVEIPGPEQTLRRAHPDRYGRILAALEKRPHSVAELLALPGLRPEHQMSVAELICVLLGTGIAVPFQDAVPKAQAACARLNRLIEVEGQISDWRHATMAAASLRAGLVIPESDFDLYLALRRGERPDPGALATRFAARCKERGGYPIVNERHFPNEAEAREALIVDYARKIERLAPLWNNAGVIEAPA